ncbi:DUF4041 domain-containing protein [Staphylococcus hyicus]|uniref:DUF4041 domain-containing protein n=1 Tax=Staphylococcus hyicus TaxID=1284 RepID=UPI0036D40DBC
MEKSKITKNWVSWTILISSLFAIATPGVAIIPLGLSIYMVAKLTLIDKNIDVDVVSYQELKVKNQELEELNSDLSRNIGEATDELDYLIKQLNNKIDDYDLMITYPFELMELDSFEINNQIKKLEIKEKELLNVENTSLFDSNANKRHRNAQSRQIIRLFNAESALLIDKVSSKNIETVQNKLFKCYQTMNKLFETDGVHIPETVLDIKLKQLHLIHQYQLKLEEEREIRREEKARIQEEKKVERELENKLKELEKDIKHHNNEISKLTKYLSKANADIEKELFVEKIKELEKHIKELKTAKQNVNERLIKAQSGYVYIISNIGSFGENIYKIGVTRRFKPMDRIKELGDASVPFEFDVHALIFSENAFDLEKKLHDHFKDNQVNKVNNRKEFYNVDLKEIENIVLKEFNGTAKFTYEPKAEQYRESKSI